ncbi:Rrf2 family transcriptional regulator [Cellulophaga sp. F20128]|uniref:RrF2 family transcriptional regulator n=1 Tax=Cellulophaga sp. F20128 TaxID=2926413 RepID=UPI001FF3CFD3|nr:Rrf2 family transcriptional regulator [Cellulophaga sp. F20128]MCK0156787.1 Rrf2 family transcriptional regulator [Cellulophaga sp. F20128]
MFSKSCEYGIKATLFIAQKSQQGERVPLKEIAAAIDSPIAFTAKILQILAKANIVDSTKGPNGGFEIEEVRLPNITLKQIVQAIDGDGVFEGCALGLSICNANEPCPMHNQFVIIRNQLNETLSSSNLLNVAMDLNLGLTVLKR